MIPATISCRWRPPPFVQIINPRSRSARRGRGWDCSQSFAPRRRRSSSGGVRLPRARTAGAGASWHRTRGRARQEALYRKSHRRPGARYLRRCGSLYHRTRLGSLTTGLCGVTRQLSSALSAFSTRTPPNPRRTRETRGCELSWVSWAALGALLMSTALSIQRSRVQVKEKGMKAVDRAFQLISLEPAPEDSRRCSATAASTGRRRGGSGCSRGRYPDHGPRDQRRRRLAAGRDVVTRPAPAR
jgi:hypothetical protein